jgi:hypothetical protein
VDSRGLGNWWSHASATQKLIAYGAFVLTVSLIVQIIATIFLSHG